MLKNCKYTTWYYSIVNKAQQQSRIKLKRSDPLYIYYERHHILPRSLGGLNNTDNLVLLTPREHFVCHWLLTKMTSGESHQKMLCAFSGLNNWKTERNLTSKQYDVIKRYVKQRKQTPESNKKRSEKLKGRVSTRKGQNYNDFYGEERALQLKQQLSRSLLGKKKSTYKQRTSGGSSKSCTDGTNQFTSIKAMAEHHNTSTYRMKILIEDPTTSYQIV